MADSVKKIVLSLVFATDYITTLAGMIIIWENYYFSTMNKLDIVSVTSAGFFLIFWLVSICTYRELKWVYLWTLQQPKKDKHQVHNFSGTPHQRAEQGKQLVPNLRRDGYEQEEMKCPHCLPRTRCSQRGELRLGDGKLVESLHALPS